MIKNLKLVLVQKQSFSPFRVDTVENREHIPAERDDRADAALHASVLNTTQQLITSQVLLFSYLSLVQNVFIIEL